MRSRGLLVDRAGFDTAMAEQKAKARAAWKGSGSKASDDIWPSEWLPRKRDAAKGRFAEYLELEVGNL